jgi:hypothetical protein
MKVKPVLVESPVSYVSANESFARLHEGGNSHEDIQTLTQFMRQQGFNPSHFRSVIHLINCYCRRVG